MIKEEIVLRMEYGYTYEQAARLPGKHIANYRGEDGGWHQHYEIRDKTGQILRFENIK